MGNLSERGKDGVGEDINDFERKYTKREDCSDSSQFSAFFNGYIRKYHSEGVKFDLESLSGVEELENYGMIPLMNLRLIFLFLQPNDLFHIFLTCRLFNRVCQTNSFWKEYHGNYFRSEGDVVNIPLQNHQENWKKGFHDCLRSFDYKKHDEYYEKALKSYDQQQSNGSTNYDLLVRAVIIGNMFTGKSSLMNCFFKSPFVEERLKTIGVDFKIRTVNIANVSIKLQVWDTSGDERFQRITESYFRGSHIFIICFSLHDKKTLEGINVWFKSVFDFCDPSCSNNIVLVGCKADDNKKRKVFLKDVVEKINELNKEFNGLELILEDSYVECSAKKGSCCVLPFGLGLRKFWKNNTDQFKGAKRRKEEKYVTK